MNTYTCPVCGFDGLDEPPSHFNICPSCGTEFGYHDARRSHDVLREQWIERGARWHSRAVAPPVNWDAFSQLAKAGFIDDLELTGHSTVTAGEAGEMALLTAGAPAIIVQLGAPRVQLLLSPVVKVPFKRAATRV